MKLKKSEKYFVLTKGNHYFVVGDQGDMLPGSWLNYSDADKAREEKMKQLTKETNKKNSR